ncbi:MAG TPA: beta-ketoacyl synthase N-terminal-like domain-containing protein [Candidatus Methylomirabilis sp.]|nr:beta-ketoacyl synthase N-terminal-like domain-containing protein [Candidatus Methylomirabilis sp.]
MQGPAVRGLGILLAEATTDGEAQPVWSLGRPAPRDERQRRASRECLLGLAAVEAMLDDEGAPREAIAGERTALVYATAGGYAASNRSFIEGSGRSIHFAYTAPAVVPAEVAIQFGITGPYAIFLGGPPATLRAIWHASILLDSGSCDRALVLAVETFEECADLYARGHRLAKRPLVEAAGCLWLEPGRGDLVFESRGASRRRPGHARARGAETFGCEPLVALDQWRRAPAPGPLVLTGVWRGEEARLVWSEAPSAHRRIAGTKPQSTVRMRPGIAVDERQA